MVRILVEDHAGLVHAAEIPLTAYEQRTTVRVLLWVECLDRRELRLAQGIAMPNGRGLFDWDVSYVSMKPGTATCLLCVARETKPKSST